MDTALKDQENQLGRFWITVYIHACECSKRHKYANLLQRNIVWNDGLKVWMNHLQTKYVLICLQDCAHSWNCALHGMHAPLYAMISKSSQTSMVDVDTPHSTVITLHNNQPCLRVTYRLSVCRAVAIALGVEDKVWVLGVCVQRIYIHPTSLIMLNPLLSLSHISLAWTLPSINNHTVDVKLCVKACLAEG